MCGVAWRIQWVIGGMSCLRMVKGLSTGRPNRRFFEFFPTEEWGYLSPLVSCGGNAGRKLPFNPGIVVSSNHRISPFGGLP